RADGQVPIVFSGNIQGRHVRETGAKGCLILNIDPANQVTSEFHPLDVVRWSVFEHDISEDHQTDDALDAFGPWLESQLQEAEHRPLGVRVRLTGASPLHDAYHQAARALEGDLRSIALQNGRGRVWFEQLRIRTQKRIATTSNGFALGPDADGPYASLHLV